jgi:hypothetical protein
MSGSVLPNMGRLLCLSQLRIEAPDPQPDQCCFHTIDEPALLANQALALAAWSLSILLPQGMTNSNLVGCTTRPSNKGQSPVIREALLEAVSPRS